MYTKQWRWISLLLLCVEFQLNNANRMTNCQEFGYVDDDEDFIVYFNSLGAKKVIASTLNISYDKFH